MDDALNLSEVRKTYPRGVEALKGISLRVPQGVVFGLLGPNGAGKSTLVSILNGLVRPSVCRGTMLGQPIGTRKTLRRVGFLPEHVRFPDYLTGRQVIEFSAGLHQVPSGLTKKRTDELLELVSMAEQQKRKMKGYSKGMKQRIGLAQALVNDPDIVFLDEPTDGVDPEGRIDFLRIIKDLKDRGKTVFLNSHLLPEVESIADRVAILSEGRILKEGDMGALSGKGAEYYLEYAGKCPAELIESLGCSMPEDGLIVIQGDVDVLQQVIDILRSNKLVIRGISKREQSLQDLFLEVVKLAGGGIS